jgi:outer membrane protein OmpA-like peptidoglycan-associated protein
MERSIARLSSFRSRSALAVALLMSVAGSALAGEHPSPRYEIGPFGGIIDFDTARHLNGNIYGGRFGVNISPYLGIEAVVGASKVSSPIPNTPSETIWLSNIDLVVHPVRAVVEPYISGGIGSLTSYAITAPSQEAQNQFNFDLGGGINIWLAEHVAVRCDYHGYWASSGDAAGPNDPSRYRDMMGTVGLSMGLGNSQPIVDTDRDGVADDFDRCSETPLGTTVDSFGCPPDADGDGVADSEDQCAGTPPQATVSLSGCPSDSDNDGMFDGIDSCPGTPKNAQIDSKGCPIDSDRDGVFDGIDRCNGTALGVSVDQHGCPMPTPEPKTQVKTVDRWLVMHNLTFKTGSAEILPSSHAPLNEVASSLIASPEVRIEICGYADSRGSDAANLALTQKRAEAVRDYLIGRGIEPSRLRARGFGEADPMGNNATPEGRAMNRRVEFHRIHE